MLEGQQSLIWGDFYLLPVWELCLPHGSCRYLLFPVCTGWNFGCARCALCRSWCHWGSAGLCQAFFWHFLHNVCKTFINQGWVGLGSPGSFPGMFLWDVRAWAGLQGALGWNCGFISGQIGVKHLQDSRKRWAEGVEFCHSKGRVAPAFEVYNNLKPNSSAHFQCLLFQTLVCTWIKIILKYITNRSLSPLSLPLKKWILSPAAVASQCLRKTFCGGCTHCFPAEV